MEKYNKEELEIAIKVINQIKNNQEKVKIFFKDDKIMEEATKDNIELCLLMLEALKLRLNEVNNDK